MNFCTGESLSADPKSLHVDIAENIHKLLSAALGKKHRISQRTNLRFAAEGGCIAQQSPQESEIED